MILSKVYEDAEHRLERNEITLGEFERLVDIEVIEPKHGEWVYKPYDYDESTWECSNCKEPWTLIDGTPQDNNMNFCPNCGADMRKESE